MRRNSLDAQTNNVKGKRQKFEEGIHMATLRKTKLKFFKDLKGERVAMNSKRLTEVMSKTRNTVWFTTPKMIRRAAEVTRHGEDFFYNLQALDIFRRFPTCTQYDAYVGFGRKFSSDVYCIGCHEFSEKTFRAILRYAGVKNV
jgi:hypothetical protein